MRLLFILLIAFCWSATGFSQKGSQDLILIEYATTNAQMEEMPLKEKILMISGKTVKAAKGYKIVYSKKLKQGWVQPDWLVISAEEFVAMKKKKKKDKKKKMSGMTVNCNGVDGCDSCVLRNIGGSSDSPVYGCVSTGCSCFVLMTPDKDTFAEFVSAGGDNFPAIGF